MASKLLSLKGRVAIVTGAGGGLGEKYAIDLAKRGASIIVNDTAQSADRVRAIVKEIISNGGIAKENINSVLDGKEIVADAINHFGSCDILINNAGILRDKSFIKMTSSDWKSVLDVHLQGTFEICHAAWPTLREKEYGRIVNIASGAGLYGNFGQANYSAAKMGILGLTNTLSIEGKKYNITANCVIPIAASQMTANVLPPQYLELFDPSHITGIVSYLSHESSSSVSGEAFEVGGGWYSKIRWERSKGISLNINDKFASAEDIADHFTAICSFESSAHPTELTDSLQAMIAASFAKKESDKLADSNGHSGHNTASILNDVVADNFSVEEAVTLQSGPVVQTEIFFLELQQYLSDNPERAWKAANILNASIRFEINDPSGKELVQSWCLNMMVDKETSDTMKSKVYFNKENIKDTRIRTDIVIICNDETFIALKNGTLSKEVAFITGRLKVKGPYQKGIEFFNFYLSEVVNKK